MNLKYNYVVLSWVFSSSNINEDYYYICLKDLEGIDGVIVNHEALQERPKWLRYLYKLHHYPLLNSTLKLPFKELWYPYVFKNTFKDDKPICFICIRYPSSRYLKYLKSRFPNCKVVVMCRDLLKTHRAAYDAYTKEGVYDYWMSYDEEESKKYGFPHFDEFESKIEIPISNDYPISDVFFAGRAKDRLTRLIDIYDRLEAMGINCLFYIVGVEKGKEIERKGIRYLTKQISYYEMLRLSINSKCILEINQEGAEGYSSRFLEAVMFNKKLMTDNVYIKKSKFYKPEYIQFVNSDNFNADFLMDDSYEVDYHYNGEFSPLLRIEQIDAMLSKEA